ncbi:MAG TPA: DinB family protein [Acidimicrobiales bacterium]|nr:DinB family protein [Acidimicrobiales bacterium]
MPGFPTTEPTESEQLLVFLAQQRRLLSHAAYGLTDEQARLTPSVSALSVGGIVKHVSQVEKFWTDVVLGRQAPFGTGGDYQEGFRLGPDESLAGTFERYAAIGRETERIVRSLPIDHPVAVPRDVPWFPADTESWALRWILLHLIEETARHAGHADIVRESIDRATWFALMAGAENWPPSPWVKPWQPPGSVDEAHASLAV